MTKKYIRKSTTTEKTPLDPGALGHIQDCLLQYVSKFSPYESKTSIPLEITPAMLSASPRGIGSILDTAKRRIVAYDLEWEEEEEEAEEEEQEGAGEGEEDEGEEAGDEGGDEELEEASNENSE